MVTLSEVTELKCTSEQLLARERQQRVIARLGLAALDDGDLDQFMDRTTRELMETLELDHCKILELQPGGKRLLLRAGVGWNQGLVGYGWVDAGLDSQAGYTLSKPDEPVIVDDLNKETRFTGPDLLLKHGVTSGLSCVILAGNHIYGVIGGHTREPRKFSQEDLNFLQSAANVVGSSINRHQDRLRQNLENAVSATLQKRYVVDDTLAAIQSIVVAELRCETSELWWTDEHGCFVCRHHYTLPQVWRQQTEDRDSELNSGMADCLAMRVFTEKRAVWATDIGEPALFTAESPAVKLGFTSAFGLPICTDDKVLGVMVFYARRRLFGIDVFLRSLENLGSTVGAELARQLQK